MDASRESREGSPPTASRGSGSATTRSARCTATSQTRPGTVFPRIAINAAVIARCDAVSVVVQRAKSTGGIRHYDPSMPRRMLRTFDRKWRETRMVARGFQSASHPSSRRSFRSAAATWRAPTATSTTSTLRRALLATMRERLDHLARLRTANIEISGGEPLLHPDLDELIRHIRGTGALAGLITNGYLLNEKRIEDFNDAGLDHLQISIDNVTPDDVSKKSLKVLDAKLQMLAKHAAFSVNINSVLGGGLSPRTH